MDENIFDLGLDVATISAELPDPVITLSGADNYTVQDTADYPLIALNVYGNSVQDGTPTPEAPINIVSVGDDGTVIITVDNGSDITLSAEITSGLPLCSVGNVRDELIYNADGTGKIIKRTAKLVVDGTNEKGIVMSYDQTTGVVQWRSNFLTNMHINNGSVWGNGLCSHAEYNTVVSMAFSHFAPILDNNYRFLRFWFQNIGVQTNNELNAWLQSNPVTVIYQLATPQEIELTAEEMAALQQLQSFEETTYIYNDSGADMTVKVLRRDYDMKYIDWIKESQTWTCPKAGKWKAICVGGGASGGIYEKATSSGATEQTLIATVAGGTTSFGSIVAADGAPSTNDYTTRGYSGEVVGVSGYGGYTGVDYGGAPSIGNSTTHQEFAAAVGNKNAGMYAIANPAAALGYGAGGGAVGRFKANYDVSPIPGRAGAIESTIVDLDEGQTILCTIGKGGQTTDATFMGSGADGIIVVQYLGY